jgi:hypothetical protein
MSEHVMQLPHPDLAVIPEDERLEKSPYKDINPEDLELYRRHVVHYFDNQLNKDILMLPEMYKEKLFQMLTDYADVLEKIFHPGIPILEYILGKLGAAAREHPHPGINFNYQCPIIAEYKDWVAKQQPAQEASEEPQG